MTPAQKKLKELRERQSRERGRMSELGLADALTDETRSELDGIEKGTADLERQLRAAQVAVDQEEGEQQTEQRAAVPDAEHRERIELRGKASLGAFLTAAAKGRLPDGPEGELLAAAGVRAGQIPLELWDVGRPAEQRQVREDRATADRGTWHRGRQSRPDPAGRDSPTRSCPALAWRCRASMSGTYATGTISTSQSAAALAKSAAAAGVAGAITVTTSDAEKNLRPP